MHKQEWKEARYFNGEIMDWFGAWGGHSLICSERERCYYSCWAEEQDASGSSAKHLVQF